MAHQEGLSGDKLSDDRIVDHGSKLTIGAQLSELGNVNLLGLCVQIFR